MSNNKSKQSKKRVLFFDDEPHIAGTLAKTLMLFGWNVKLVSDVNKVFNNLNSFKPDIIIMDIMAPVPQLDNEHGLFTKKDIDYGMTGIVLAKKIWEKSPKLPILFLTAKSQPESINQLKQERKCEYIRKPVLAITISENLERLLKPNVINKPK